jgi:hypothetical protein
MRQRKLGLWIPALTLGALVGAVRADEVATPAGADAPPVAEAPAGTPNADALPLEAEAPAAEPQAAPPDPAAVEAAEAMPLEAGAEAEVASDSAAPEAASEPASPEAAPALGAVGYDSEGRAGRIHIVRRGDTLWDISDAYLGTPWVWPSIWRDNGEIENPHRIFPGDRIWITPSEMRKISAEEAALLLSNLPPGQELEPAAAEEIFPRDEAPAEPQLAAVPVEHGNLRVSSRETAGLISPEQLEAAASIVGRQPERVLLSQEDRVYIGSGDGAVKPGDELTIFRTNEKVFDPDTGRLLGYHIEFLGYVQVEETHPESSIARIRMSTGEVHEGDRLIPREPLPAEIPIQASPAEVEGKISFFPQQRVLLGWNDFVYLNRGSVDGLEVGSPLEVFRPGYATDEPAREETVQVPDRVVARLVVVRTADESAVAVITKADTELRLGDRFRGASAALASID